MEGVCCTGDNICYNERSMQRVSHNSVIKIVEREEWKVYVIRDFPFFYIETMVGEKSWCLLYGRFFIR